MVAVGLADMAGALRLATAEALSRGVGVHLVHVARASAGRGASQDEAQREAVDQGRLLLGSAASGVRQLGGPGLRVTTALVEHGGVVDALLVQGAHAGLIVLQHRRLGALRRLGTRSVTNGVATRTRVPVVGVPTGWTPGPDDGGCVLVGVQEPGEVPALLTVACAEAARREVPVRVVHDPGRDDGSAAAVWRQVEGFRRAWPDVVVEPPLERSPLAVLEAPMTAAQVAVLGRHHTALPVGSHLGPVARRALEVSRYPVLLVAVDAATAQEAASG